MHASGIEDADEARDGGWGLGDADPDPSYGSCVMAAMAMGLGKSRGNLGENYGKCMGNTWEMGNSWEISG